VVLELLKKKGAMTETELFEDLREELGDLGSKEFNELLMRLEVNGKVRTTSLARGKKRIELVE
jgi:hypothetical protein